MLKKIMNEAFLTVRITTTGPLLIKSGFTTVGEANATPVLTFRNGRQEVFIPGSSLKGVFRSHVERVAGSLKTHVVCYPFSPEENSETNQELRRGDYRESCGEMFNKIAKRDEGKQEGKKRTKLLDARKDMIYAASCPVCRLFGSTSFIGRIAINDAYLTPDTTELKELRDGVGIDRLTGGASHSAKFDLEVVTTGVVFETDIHIRNFELWQLGMVFIVLQDMEDGLISLGSGRSRGLGKVKAKIVDGVTLSTINNKDVTEDTKQVWGLGKWLDDGTGKTMEKDEVLGLTFPGSGDYGTWRDDMLTLPSVVEHKPDNIRLRRVFKDDALDALRAGTIEQFTKRIKAWPPEVQLTTNRAGRS